MRVELTHDLLAKKIRETVSEKNKGFLNAKKILESKYDLYINNPKILLSDIELNTVEPYLEKLILTESQIDFYELSRKTQDRKATINYIRNIVNISAIFIIVALMIIITQYQKSVKRYEQNIHLATLLTDLLNKVSQMKSSQDLARLKLEAKDLRSNVVNSPQLSAFFNENTDEVKSIKQSLIPTTLDEMQTRKLSFFYTIKGKVVNSHNKGIKHAQLKLVEQNISFESDEAGYFELVIENSLLSPDKANTLLIEAGNSYNSVEIKALEERIDDNAENQFIDLDKITLKDKN